MESEDESKITNVSSFWTRLTVDRFDYTVGLNMDKTIFDADEYGFQRGRYDKRADFLILSIGYAVGLFNFWTFPIKVYENGGVVFFIPYFIFSFGLGLPMVILEMGLGQFTSLSCIKVFKCVPILFGIGWSQIVVSCITIIYYSVLISYAYLYLFGSFFQPLQWSLCNNSFNSLKCFSSLSMKDFNQNKSTVPSSAEFYYAFIVGIESKNRSLINQYPSMPQWHLSLCLLIVWVIAFLLIVNSIKITGKVAYFTVLYPYVALAFLFVLGCTLPGAAQGLKFYLKPNITKLREPMIYLNAFEHCFASLGISIGGLITLSSHNNFHDNFYRDSVILVWIDCLTSVFCGLAVFPLVGYLTQITNIRLDRFMHRGSGLIYIIILEALSTLNGSNMWTILFMLIIIALAMDTQFVILETIVTAIGDRFVEIHTKILYRIFGVFFICLLSYLCGILFTSPVGIYYIKTLDEAIKIYGLPFIAFLECLTIGIVYGQKNFRRDIEMMIGFQLNSYFFISMTYICPFAIFLLVLYKTISHSTSLWNKINLLIIILIFAPVVIGAIHIIIRYRSRYEDNTLEQYFNYLIKPPIYYGPHYKVNWLLNKEYKGKLIVHRKNPKFLSHVSKYENVKIIYKAIKKTESKKKSKYRKSNNPTETWLRILEKQNKEQSKLISLL